MTCNVEFDDYAEYYDASARLDPKQHDLHRVHFRGGANARPTVIKESGLYNGGVDSLMMGCSYVYEHKGRKYMLYNGNGFGETDFRYAVLDE
jgi:hypothetical protein